MKIEGDPIVIGFSLRGEWLAPMRAHYLRNVGLKQANKYADFGH